MNQNTVSPPAGTPRPPSGAVSKILLWNFGAAVVVALLVGATHVGRSDAPLAIGLIYLIAFPIVNGIGLIISAFLPSGTRSALLGFLLAILIMPIVGFGVCAVGFPKL